MDRLLEHTALIGFLNLFEADFIRELINQLSVVFAIALASDASSRLRINDPPCIICNCYLHLFRLCSVDRLT
jgi:hypothetical protein